MVSLASLIPLMESKLKGFLNSLLEEDFFPFFQVEFVRCTPSQLRHTALDPIQLLASIWETLPRVNIVCNNFSRKDIESSQNWNSLRLLPLGGWVQRKYNTEIFPASFLLILSPSAVSAQWSRGQLGCSGSQNLPIKVWESQKPTFLLVAECYRVFLAHLLWPIFGLVGNRMTKLTI